MTPQELAGWDIPALRRGSAQLSQVVEASRSWTTRVDAVTWSLSAPGAWDGDGSEAGLGSLATWLAVAARVHPALLAVAEGVADAVGWYAQAQDTAASALRAAGAAGISVGPDGLVGRPPELIPAMDTEQAAAVAEAAAVASAVQSMLDEAFRLAARGDALVASEVGVFTGLTVSGFTSHSGFADLMAALHVAAGTVPRLPAIPTDAGPVAVAAWWSGLSADAQLRLARERPDLIGGLDGVPAWARDTANRVLLGDLLARLDAQLSDPGVDLVELTLNGDLLFALAVQEALGQAEAGGGTAQLYAFDVENQLAAISVGDLDRAANVAVIVPGTAVDVAGDMVAQVGRAQNLVAATGAPQDVAVLAWIGYDTPNLLQAPGTERAVAGAPLLATTLAGLSAARPGNPARTTVIAHSYGTLTTSLAAAEPGPLRADAVVLVGSPGTGGRADDFDAPADQVFVGEAQWDWIADTGALGADPGWRWWYGGTCISADMPHWWDRDHYHYFDPDSEALANMAMIVQGRYDEVAGCDH